MKFRRVILTLILGLYLAQPAWSERVRKGQFTVLKPAGWTTQVKGDQLLVESADKTAVVILMEKGTGDLETAWKAMLNQVTGSISNLKYTQQPGKAIINGMTAYLADGSGKSQGRNVRWGLGLYGGSQSSLIMLYMTDNPAGTSHLGAVNKMYNSVSTGSGSANLGEESPSPQRIVQLLYDDLARNDESRQSIEQRLSNHQSKFTPEFYRLIMTAHNQDPPNHVDINIFNNAQVGQGPTRTEPAQVNGSQAAVVIHPTSNFRGNHPLPDGKVFLTMHSGQWRIDNIVFENTNVKQYLQQLVGGR